MHCQNVCLHTTLCQKCCSPCFSRFGGICTAGDTLLARPVEQLCAGADKPQRECTYQFEEYRHRRLQVEYAQFSADDRRRVAFRNCDQYSMQFVFGWPDYDCAVSNLEWEIGTARVLGRAAGAVPRAVPRHGHRQV